MKKYIWRNRDHDQVIEVERILGRGPDNRIYLKVLGSDAGIPLDECKELVESTSKKPVSNSIRIVRI